MGAPCDSAVPSGMNQSFLPGLPTSPGAQEAELPPFLGAQKTLNSGGELPHAPASPRTTASLLQW